MKRTTKKLTGVGLELFLRRFYASYGDINDGLARQLAKDCRDAFTSIRVRRVAWRDWRGTNVIAATAKAQNMSEQKPAPPIVASEPESTVVGENTLFDPYAIGLVPTYQREGADGLLAKLTDVTSVDNLRKMARSQQVALPAELRRADADIGDIRGAIVAAVGKRIANRRAAAG